MSRLLTTSPADASLLARRLGETRLVIALCAAWCGTCKEFQAVFARIAQKRPDAVFVWLDIEDDSALAGDVDVEDFPTLAVFRDGVPVHFGVSLPQEGVVTRLLSALLEANVPPASVPKEVAELPHLLRDRSPVG
ncbi:MAG: thioredoxin family protein [Burkholderiaceae bacterium]|jgi:thioredoxin reductase (NADPH)